jgi:hypothetical protein
MRQLSEMRQRLSRPAQLSYSKMAIGMALGSTAIAIVVNVVMMVVSLGLGYLPIAVISSAIPGPLGYLSVRLAWVINREKLSRMGHRW